MCVRAHTLVRRHSVEAGEQLSEIGSLSTTQEGARVTLKSPDLEEDSFTCGAILSITDLYLVF